MTCIVGLTYASTVYIGADSAGVSGYDLTVRRDKKLFVNGPYAMGFTTSFRMGQLLQHAFDAPKPPDDAADLHKFMVTEFINQVRKCLKDGGWSTKTNEQETAGTFLVGVRGRLFKVCDDYQVVEADVAYDACGCGESYARAALWTSVNLGVQLNPETRVLTALRCAGMHSAGVREPFSVISTSPENDARIEISTGLNGKRIATCS